MKSVKAPDGQHKMQIPTKEYEQLLKELTDRIWHLWRQELRQEQERQGKPSRR